MFGHTAPHGGSQFPHQGQNSCFLHWKHKVLTTGNPGKFKYFVFKRNSYTWLKKSKGTKWYNKRLVSFPPIPISSPLVQVALSYIHLSTSCIHNHLPTLFFNLNTNGNISCTVLQHALFTYPQIFKFLAFKQFLWLKFSAWFFAHQWIPLPSTKPQVLTSTFLHHTHKPPTPHPHTPYTTHYILGVPEHNPLIHLPGRSRRPKMATQGCMMLLA